MILFLFFCAMDAGLLMLSTRIVVKFTSSYLTVFIAAVLLNLLNLGLRRGSGAFLGPETDGTVLLVGACISIILQAIILKIVLTNQKYNEEVSFWQACLISILHTILLTILVIVLRLSVYGRAFPL
jgi:hypothetical protein